MLASVAAGELVALAGPCERDIVDHRLERCPETDDLTFAIGQQRKWQADLVTSCPWASGSRAQVASNRGDAPRSGARRGAEVNVFAIEPMKNCVRRGYGQVRLDLALTVTPYQCPLPSCTTANAALWVAVLAVRREGGPCQPRWRRA